MCVTPYTESDELPLLAIGREPLELDRSSRRSTREPASRQDRTARSSRSSGWCATTTSDGASNISSTRRTTRSRSRRSSGSPPKWQRRWPGVAAGAAPSDRPPGDRRGQRRDRRRIAASRRRLRRVPLHDRARQADRADLEARVLRGRRRLDRGGDRRSRRRDGAGRSGADGMRVTVRLFARLRDIAGAAEMARDVAARRDDRQRLAAARQRVPGARALRALDFERRQRRLRADGHRASTTATRSRFCRRFREDRRSTQSPLRTQRSSSLRVLRSPRSTLSELCSTN